MDLRQLEYVVAIDDHGTFTSAARALHVSQPSLSSGVRSLESELGVELFARLGRSVRATAAGRGVIDASRRVLRDMADVRAAAATVSTLITGTLDIAALPTLAVEPVATLIGTFRRQHPGISIRVHEPETTAELEHSLRAGRAELGFTDITTGGAGLLRIELSRQEIVVISPPGSADPAEPLSAKALAALPLVVTPAGTSTRRLLDQTVARSGSDPTIAVEISHREALVPLVLAGAGSGLLPRTLADAAAQRGAVVRELRPALSRRIGIVHRAAPLSPASQAMIALALTSR